MKVDFNQIDFSKLELDLEKVELISFLSGIKPTLFYLANNFELSKLIVTKLNQGKKLYFGELMVEDLDRRCLDKKEGIILKNENERKYLIVSRNKKTPEKLIESYLRCDFEKVGRLLGYPSCCARQFMKDIQNKSHCIQGILRRTSGKPAYFLNSIYNFSGRLNAKDTQNLKELGKINAKGYSFYLISHHPCSFHCKKSIEIGRKILRALRKFDSKTAQFTESILRKPVLFLNNFQWITFDGWVKNNIIFYQSISSPKSLIERRVLEKIEKGDKLSLEKKEVVIFKENKIIDHLNFRDFDPIILNFQSL